MPFSNLSFFYLDDFVAVGKRVEKLVSRLKISLILMKIGLMSLSGILMWKLLSWLLRTRLTPKKIGMISPSRVVRLGVRIVIESSVGCIHTIREHLLSLVCWTLPQIRGSRHGNRCNPDLAFGLG